jgi:steroid delta-isomerase-like uncharacterized protein
MVEQAMSSPTTVARESFDALKRRDLDALQELWHPDVVDDFTALGQFYGKGMARAFFEELFGAFPDFEIEALHVIGDDEHAVVQWRATGTFTGSPFQGVHATGRSVELRGCDVMRIENGKLKRNTIYYDGLGFARQVGMLPREGSSADKAMTAACNAGTDLRARLRRSAKPMAHAG